MATTSHRRRNRRVSIERRLFRNIGLYYEEVSSVAGIPESQAISLEDTLFDDATKLQ